MTECYFTLDHDQLVPEAAAHSPWANDMLHGRFLGGIGARAVELHQPEPRFRVTRLTVDLFRPAAMAPVRVKVVPVRQGRKLRIVDAEISCDGHEVARVTALLLATGVEPPGQIWRPDPTGWPDPDEVPDHPGATEPWVVRTAAGGFQTGERSQIWSNDTISMVGGEKLTPLVRAALSGDIACPLANSSDQGLFYINADYTMMLARYPEGDWIGVEVAQQLQSDGISLASATLIDEHGPFATSSGTSLARPPLDMQ